MKDRSLNRLHPVLLAIVVGACASVLASSQGPADPQAPDRSLRVMSYNIHHGTGTAAGCPPGVTPDCDFDLARTAEVIRAADADVVALQEVDRFWNRSAGTDQPAELAAALGMQSCYGANLSHQPDGHASVPHEYGTAILSKHDILECDNTFLPSTRPASGDTPAVNREQRGLLEVRLNVRGVPVRVYNTHLEHTAAFQDVRTAQVNRIIDLVGDFEEPTVLMGDLNARPDAPELQPLFAVFRDAWIEAGDGGSGYTYPAALTVEPDRRIDYILLSSQITAHSVEVLVNDDRRRTSDHYPVRAEISVPGSEVGIGRP